MLGEPLRQALTKLDPASPRYATDAVDLVLSRAAAARVSDVHLQPTPEGLELHWRVDGVLHPVGLLPAGVAPNLVARLKVLAELLTYRNDVPQEGRIRVGIGQREMRVSTFPTLHGERAVVRMFAGPGPGRFERLDDLGLPSEIVAELRGLLGETTGAVIVAGPAGSGKTTTLYTCLRELVAASGCRSIVTLEDPIEGALPGVVQSQVQPQAGFTLEAGLRSLMRQDPEIIAVGEIRDRATAEIAFQASLTGHLVLTTFHAGSAVGALGRLSDMGIEPYLIRSGLRAVAFQRLVRRLCPACSRSSDEPGVALGLPARRCFVGVGCEECDGTGYQGRAVVAEIVLPDRGALGRAVLERADTDRLERAAHQDGAFNRWQRAVEVVEGGITTPAEIRRVLGFTGPPTFVPDTG
jgi:type II secretory ATPase GspE/PulE/Tfp pilus assembly ATPase PilB-like protein